MNPNDLPFDTETMIAGLRPWIECESPTFDAPAVERMLDRAADDFAAIGATIERIPGRMGFAGCLRAHLPHPAPGPGILVMGHVDTVHPVGSMPFRRDGDRIHGPGIQDMKGGIYAAFEAVRQLARAGIPTAAPVTFLLTSDEEVGSPSTRDLIESEAKQHRLVLVPEPAQSDGGVTTGRFAIARFDLRATGRSSHAGARLADGRSAIHEMARQILAIEGMTTPACTFSVGVIHGGQWVNCVPTICKAEALTMAKRQPDLDHAVQRMLALSHESDGLGFTATRGVTRPVWEPSPATMALYQQARTIAAQIGFDLPHASAGGGSDGNFTGAIGIPTLDGLGVEGAGLHTPDEHILADGLVRRARLLAGLLAADLLATVAV